MLDKNGEPHGKGRNTEKDGSFYEGDWVHNKMEGKGKIVDIDGTYYIGYFKKDLKVKGFQRYANGETYFGDFKHQSPNGHGEYTYPDGRRYVGEVRNGLKHGKGTMTTSYEGIWNEDKLIKKI